MKRLLSMILALALIVSCVPAVYAEDAVTVLEPVTKVHINPLYADVLEEAHLVQPRTNVAATPVACSGVAEAAEYMRGQMKERAEHIAMDLVLSEYNDMYMDQIFNEAVAHTGVPTEGDYLLWQYGGWSCSVSGYSDGVSYYLTFEYTITYYTTARQERQVDSAVAALLAELGPDASNPYSALKTVYDWMCDNIYYDYDNLNDKSYLLKHSAYAALIDRTAVCQGYAVLLYRLLLEMGIDNRVITGISDGQGHAWNIVKLGDLYYNVDATWDASWAQSGLSYAYFLRCDTDFDDHYRDAAYSSVEFETAYPMSPANYVPGDEGMGDTTTSGDFQVSIENGEATLVKYLGSDTEVVIPETIDGATVVAIGERAFCDNDRIRSVSLPATVKTIKDGDLDQDVYPYHAYGAFAHCDALETVIIPADSQLTYIGEWTFNKAEKLANIELPASIEILALSCFEECASLKELVLPEGLRELRQNAISNSGIENIYVPASCTEFHWAMNAPSLVSITVAEGNPNYRSHEGVLYANTEDGWTLLIYPKHKQGASYTVPDFCSNIFGDTFVGEYNEPEYLEELYIGDCMALKGAMGGNSLSRIRATIVPNDSNPYFTSKDGMILSKDEKTLIQVPGSLTGTVLIPDGVETIESYAAEMGSYTAMILPETVTTIDAAAFWQTSSLKTLYLPASITQMGGSQLLDSDYAVVYYGGSEAQWDAIEVTDEYFPIYPTYFNASHADAMPDGCSSGFHVEQTVPGRAAACTEEGLTDGIVCSNCGTVITEQQTIPATGHSFAGGVCTACGEAESGAQELPFEDWEWEVLKLTNRERYAAGVAPLTGFSGIQAACDIRAEELITYFDHYRPDGTKCYTALEELNVGYHSAGENIAAGQRSPTSVVNGWMNSQGHRENILDSGYQHMGVGYAYASSDYYAHYWVQMFVSTNREKNTSFSLVYPNGTKFAPGAAIDDMGVYAVVENSVYGTCYLPIIAEYCSGYDSNAEGDQNITVSALGYTATFTVTRPVHAYGDWYVTQEVTCTENGQERRDCTDCGLYETREVAATGHDYTAVVTVPTCTEGGCTTYTCHCGGSYVADETAALGHDYGERHVVTDPTCTTDGESREECSRCGEYLSYVIPAVGHWFENGVCKACGKPEVALGDANGDGAINNVDAMLILQYAVGLNNGSELNLSFCDVNGDGNINNVDAMMILQYAVGLIKEFTAAK